MNWGKGIIVVMTLFIGFITVMVIGFFAHSVDLESEDYYQREIGYESEIVSMNNANKLVDKPSIQVSASHLVVQLNNDLPYEEVHLWLKRPDDSKADQHFDIRDTRTFTVSTHDLRKGKYDLELSYKVNGKTYLQKQSIVVP